MNWLEQAEYLSLALSALGTVAAAVTQQVAYATTPLVLALLTLKPLGTHEKYLVCDRAWAMVGSHNLLSSGTNGGQREVGLRTDDPRIVAGLVERFASISE